MKKEKQTEVIEKPPRVKRAKAEAPDVSKASLIGDVIAKYVEFGWQAIRAPGGINDILAQKNKRFHFVQVVTKETIDDPKFHGLPKNDFVQNAFSNGATPIFAHVISKPCKGPDGTRVFKSKITFEDVNANGRVIIGGKRDDPEKK